MGDERRQKLAVTGSKGFPVIDQMSTEEDKSGKEVRVAVAAAVRVQMRLQPLLRVQC